MAPTDIITDIITDIGLGPRAPGRGLVTGQILAVGGRG